MTRHRFVSRRLIVAVAAIVCTAVQPRQSTVGGDMHGVTAHQLATRVGVDVLKRGATQSMQRSPGL